MYRKPLFAALPFVLACAGTTALAAGPTHAQAKAPEVKLVTSDGNIVLRLDPKQAPVTVKNFLTYVRSGFYNGTIFHRVIPGFMIQGGGFTTDFKMKPTRKPIKDEADNGLSNRRGTIAMARRAGANTATSQFFINLVDNTRLDYAGPGQPGYAVFGTVISGMDVVDKIAKTPTGPAGPFMQNVPQTPIVINKAAIIQQ